MPRTPCREIDIDPSHDPNLPTMLAPKDNWLKYFYQLNVNHVKIMISHGNFEHRFNEPFNRVIVRCLINVNKSRKKKHKLTYENKYTKCDINEASKTKI